MERRVGVGRASDGLELALDGIGLSGVVTHHGEAPDALAVEAHVLGVGLAEAELVAVLLTRPGPRCESIESTGATAAAAAAAMHGVERAGRKLGGGGGGGGGGGCTRACASRRGVLYLEEGLDGLAITHAIAAGEALGTMMMGTMMFE